MEEKPPLRCRGSPQAAVPSGGPGGPTGCGDAAPAPAAPPPPPRAFAGKLLTRFLPLSSSASVTFCPLLITFSQGCHRLSCRAQQCPAAGPWQRRLGAAVSASGRPPPSAKPLGGLPASLLLSGQRGALCLQGISTAGDDWRSRRGPSKRPTGRSETTQRG